MGGQQEVDRRAALVDGAVEGAPLAAELHIGLVDPDRAAMGLADTAQTFLDHRRVGGRPAIDGGAIDLEAALGEQAFEVAGVGPSGPERSQAAVFDGLADVEVLELRRAEIAERGMQATEL